MKCLRVTLFLLFLTAKTFQTHGQTASVIKVVGDWFGINCVALFRSNGMRMKETEAFFRILKFSMHDMEMMEIKDLEKPNIVYRYDSHRCSKMLYVVDDQSCSSRPKLEQLSHSISLTGPVWLVFLPGTISPTEYLENADIPFNSDFIIAEIKRGIVRLKQVYRVSMAHSLRITPFGYWSQDKGLIVDQYVPRWLRHDFEGKAFRVSAIENWPLTVVTDTEVGGFFGKVWRDLGERLNFSTTYIKPEGFGIGVWNGKEWKGLMGMIVKGEIDAAISEITVTTERLDVVDFLIPLYITRYEVTLDVAAPAKSARYQLFFQPPGLLIQWDLVFRPFKWEVWIALAFWSGLATLLFRVFHKIAVFYGLEDPESKGDYQYFFLIVSAFCQQANTVKPKSIACRVIVFTMYFFSSVILIIYSCTLTSMIATPKPIRPFDSLESFLDDGRYVLEQIPGSDSYTYFSNSTDRVLQDIYRTLFSKLPEDQLPKSHESALERVCKSKRIAHFGEYGVAIVSANRISQNEGCSIAVLQRSLKLLHLTMAVTKDSPYRDALNHELSRMLNTGILFRFRNINFPLWGRYAAVPDQPLPGEQLAQVNLLFVCAVFVSVCAYAIELSRSKSNYTNGADNKRNI